MPGIGFEVLLILLMIVANGVFAMSEIAVVSSRKSRLEHRAEAGDHRARRALELASHPNRFLSTVQIGITLVGIFAGAYGGTRIASQIEPYFAPLPWIGRYSDGVALTLVVVIITYLSLVIGELVPKRIGLTHPERIAGLVAGPMNVLSRVAAPLVKLLSLSTEFFLRVLGIQKGNEPPVTEAEITAMIEQGTQAGIFEEQEQDLVERVFWLGDQRVVSLMTPRWKIVCLEVNQTFDELRDTLSQHRYSRFLVCDGGIDNVIGMVEVKDLLARFLTGEQVEIRESIRKPLYVPEGMRALRLLDLFRESGLKLAVVIDEYGGIEGIVTLNDVLEEITGDHGLAPTPEITRRDDGSWLVDASLAMDDLWEHLDLEERRQDVRGDYHTVGGFVFAVLGHIPRPGEAFTSNDLRLEVLDMDGNRVDKVLISRLAQPTLGGDEGEG